MIIALVKAMGNVKRDVRMSKVLRPPGELPTINIERERTITRDSPRESSGESPIPQSNPSQSSLEEKILENLDDIEQGLKPYVGDGRMAKGIVTDFGKIDLLAIDKNDNFVALKVKMGSADHSVLCTTLACVGWLKRSMKIWSLVRLIIIAESFDEKAIFSATALPNLELMQYEIKPTFKRVKG